MQDENRTQQPLDYQNAGGIKKKNKSLRIIFLGIILLLLIEINLCTYIIYFQEVKLKMIKKIEKRMINEYLRR